MSKSYSPLSRWVLSILILLIIGYIREDIFVNINYYLYYKSHPEEAIYYPFASVYKLLVGPLSFMQVYGLKWILTPIFCWLYWYISWKCLKAITGKSYRKELTVAYTFILAIAGILMFTGYVINDFSKTYKLSRHLLGVLQSPIPIMLTAVFYYAGIKNPVQDNSSE